MEVIYILAKKIICLICLWALLCFPTFGQKDLNTWESYKNEVNTFFVLTKEVDIHQNQLDVLNKEQIKMEDQIEITKKLIEVSQIKREELILRYGNYLRNKQVQGKYYYIEQLIGSGSIKIFLDKIYAFSLLNQSTKVLHEDLLKETQNLQQRYNALETLRIQKRKIMDAMELELKSLTLKKQSLEPLIKKYENDVNFRLHLQRLDERWVQIQPTFLEKIKTFNILISNQVLPESIFDISISNNKIHANLIEERFNNALKAQSKVEDMSFEFTAGGVVVNFEELNVKMLGDFRLESSQKIVFEVENGYFENQLVSQMVIEHFLEQKKIEFDLSTMLGKSKIEKLSTKYAEIQLVIKIQLF